jgi:hypothetical protein
VQHGRRRVGLQAPHGPSLYDEHTVAEVYLEGTVCTVIVDFTASQYGYKDHPKVTA